MSLACLQDKHKQNSGPDAAPPAGAEGWAALYRAHRSLVYARCRRLLGDRHAAEDATQETFLRSFGPLACTADPEHQRRWLLRVASNYCLNQLRDRKRQAELLCTLDAGATRDTAAALADRETAACATRAVPHEARRVAWLLYVDDMRQHQVAKALGISRRTVVNRLAVFRAGVRRAMVRLDELPPTASV